MKKIYIDRETIEDGGLRYNYIMVNSTAEIKLLSEYKSSSIDMNALEYLEYKHCAFHKSVIYNAIKKLGKMFYAEITEYYQENIKQSDSKINIQNQIELYAKAIMNMEISVKAKKIYNIISEWLKDFPFPYEIKYDRRYGNEEKYCFCSIKDLIIDATLVYYVDKLIHYKKAEIKNPNIMKEIYMFYSNQLENSFEQYQETCSKEVGALDKLIIEIINYRKEYQNLYIYNKPYFVNNYYNNVQVYLEATNIMAIAFNEMELRLSTFAEEPTGKKCALPGCTKYFFPTSKQNRKKYCSPECRKIANRIKSNRCYAKKHNKKLHSL